MTAGFRAAREIQYYERGFKTDIPQTQHFLSVFPRETGNFVTVGAGHRDQSQCVVTPLRSRK